MVEFESFEKKMRILRNKNKLKGTKIYIGSYLTLEEMKMQTKIRVRKSPEQIGKKAKK